jgi:RsmE family RNA methyltransferase
MNLVLLDETELTDAGHAVVRGARARHIHDVHRAAVGDTLRIGLAGGLRGDGTITALTPDAVALTIRLVECPPPPAGVDVLLALPRPKMLRRLLAAIASMGVKRLVLVNSARVEKSYFDSPLLAPAAIDEALRLGLEQSRDTIVPQVTIERRFRPFVEDRAAGLWPPPVLRLLAHPAAERDLADLLPAPASDPIVIAIGPEGGWVPFEIDLLAAHGFQPFSAGPRVLRVDTAVPFLLGQCALIRRAAAAP